MSNWSLLFPSNYLSAADLDGADRVVRIINITPAEEVGQKKDKRPILHFDGHSKGMVLNKTNAKRIAKLFTNDTDNWIGRSITLYPSECDFGDETVPCIRVRSEAPKVSEPKKPATDLTDEELEELIRAKRARREKEASAASS